MRLDSLPEQVWIESGPQMFTALIGGEDVWDMMSAYWKGESLRNIADRHGVSHVTVNNWIRRAKVKMREAGLNADAVRGYADRHAVY